MSDIQPPVKHEDQDTLIATLVGDLSAETPVLEHCCDCGEPQPVEAPGWYCPPKRGYHAVYHSSRRMCRACRHHRLAEGKGGRR